MKTGIKRALCAFFGAAVLTTGLSACNRHHDWGHPLNAQEYAERRAKVVEKIAGKLDLTEDQKRRLNVLGDKLHEQRIALMGQGQAQGQVGDPRAEIKALIASDKFDTLRAQALANEKIAALQTKGPEVIAALADFYNSLSPAQQQQIREHLEHRAPWWRKD